MATHSSVLAWRIPGMGEPGGLPSMGSHRLGHDWSDLAAAAAERLTLSLSVHHRHVRVQVYGADPPQLVLLTRPKRNKLGLKGLSPIIKAHKWRMSLLFLKSLTERSFVVALKHRDHKGRALRADLGRTRKQLCNSISDYHDNLPIVFLSFLFFKIEI